MSAVGDGAVRPAVPSGLSGLIAVTGASGLIGRRVLSTLKSLGLATRPVVRQLDRLPIAERPDARLASGYGAFDEMRAALEGTRTLFLIPAAEAADRVDQHRRAVDAAVAAGVERIVYLSFLSAAPDATFTLARDHWHTEQHIRAAGVRWTFPRMNLYLDFIPAMVLPEGEIRGPAGQGRLAAILREDVSAACAAILVSGDHEGATYDLTGAESFTLAEAAKAMSTTGKPVVFVDETDDEAWRSRLRYGAREFEMRGWISSYQAIRDGSLATVSDHFERLTGRPPVTLQQYLGRSSPRS